MLYLLGLPWWYCLLLAAFLWIAFDNINEDKDRK